MTAAAATAGAFSGGALPDGGAASDAASRPEEVHDTRGTDCAPGDTPHQPAPGPASVSAQACSGAAELTPGRWPPAGRWTPTLAQSLCLAAALHALLVWVVGSSPPGTAQPGEGRFGSINLRLRGPLGAPPGEATGTSTESYGGPKGQARSLRWGGAVREAAVPPPDPSTPGAAREGTWNPNRTGRLDGPDTEASPAAATQPSADSAPPPPAVAPAVPTPTEVASASPARPLPASPALPAEPALTRADAPDELALPSPARAAPTSVPMLSAPSVPLPAAASLVLPPIRSEPEVPPVSPLTERPVRHSEVARILPRPTLGPSLVAPALPSVDVAPTPAPEPAALPPVAARPLRPLAPVARSPEPLSAPMASRALPVPEIREAPPEPPVLPTLAVRPARETAPIAPVAAPVPPLTQAPALPSIVAAMPASPASAVATTERPATAARPASTDPIAASAAAAPAASAAQPLPSVAAPSLPVTPGSPGVAAGPPAVAGPAPTSQVPAATAGAQTRTAAPSDPTAPAPVAGTQPASLPAATAQGAGTSSPGAARLPSGAPDAGARVGHDVATAPSAPASAPRLNLDLPRSLAGPLSSQSTKGLLQLMPRPPETRTKLEKEIEKATRPDCKQAYAGAGLLAVVPLVLDAARDKGCKW